MRRLILILVCSFLWFHTFTQTASPPSGWTIGSEKGYAQIDGEVHAANGFGFSFYGDRSITNFLSVRLSVGMGEMRGWDRTTSRNWLNHPVWNGSVDPRINYNEANSNAIYANYKTGYQEASLQAVFTFTQLPVFKNRSSFDGFLLAGIGGMQYTTMIDAIDQNDQLYDFAKIEAMPAARAAETLANLNTIADGHYETQSTPGAQFTPLYQIGAGLKWRIRRSVALSLSHRIGLSATDDLDSYRWDQDNTVNGINDIHHFSTIGLSYTFAKKAKPQLVQIPLPVLPSEPEPAPVLVSDLEPLIEPILIPPPAPRPVAVVEPEVEVVALTLAEKAVVSRAFENTEFETDKAVIRPVSFHSLNELATLLSEHPNWKLRIAGHTDNQGTTEWNLDLSQRRAKSVRAYLADRKIDIKRFIVEWYGEEQPIADNSTSEGRQRNRRVAYEIVE